MQANREEKGVKNLLEHLCFTMGGPLTEGCWKVEAVVRERRVYIGAARADEMENLPEELPREELPSGRRWLRKLDKLAIAQRWRSHFRADEPLAADTKWTLLYKEIGRPARHIEGSGAFPENWATFIDCLNDLPDVSIRQENHLEQIRFLLIETVPFRQGRKQTMIELREKLVLDRRKRMILYNRHKEDFGTERHAYEMPQSVSRLLDALDHGGLFETRIKARNLKPDEKSAHLVIHWQRHDRLEAGCSCHYDAEDMPENWGVFLAALHEAMGGIHGRFFAMNRFPVADPQAGI